MEYSCVDLFKLVYRAYGQDRNIFQPSKRRDNYEVDVLLHTRIYIEFIPPILLKPKRVPSWNERVIILHVIKRHCSIKEDDEVIPRRSPGKPMGFLTGWSHLPE